MCTHNLKLLWILLLLSNNNVRSKICCKNYFECDGDLMECNQDVIECSSNENCSINCIKGINTNPSSTCSREQGGCCQSVIKCPSGNDCHINCSYSCHNLIVHAENSSSLHITNCTETSCTNVTVYCPLHSTSMCTVNNNMINNINNMTIETSINKKPDSSEFTSFHLFITLLSTFLTFFCLCMCCVYPYYCFRIKQLEELKKYKLQNASPSTSICNSVCDSIPCSNNIETNSKDNVKSLSVDNIIDAINEDLTIETTPRTITATNRTNTMTTMECFDECNGHIEITECEIVQRIINIMRRFEELNLQNDKYVLTSNDIINLILKSIYSVNSNVCSYNMYYLFIQNDYNHLLEFHDDIESLYYIYSNIWDYKHFICDINTCSHVIQSINYKYDEKQDEELLILLLFDELHTYFIHSECINNILLETETSNTYKSTTTNMFTHNGENESLQIHMPLSNKYQSIQSNKSNKSNNESELSENVSVYLSNQMSINNNSQPMKLKNIKRQNRFVSNVEINKNKNEFAIGIRWMYWQKHKLNIFYVSPKFNNLKEELLSFDKRKYFELNDWTAVYNKSLIHLNSFKGRNLTCNNSPLVNEYNINLIKNETNISLQHIISLVIYCNFDGLQYLLKQSFHKKIENETLLLVKKRNEYYANWSKLFRECIELYGQLMRDNKNMKFYHGIINEIVFPSTIIKFCAPMSFTTSLSIVTSVCQQQNLGLILQLECYGLDVSYFDCGWISDYSNEMERVVCGGYQSFIIKNIMLIKLKQNYKQYLKAINIIISLINGPFYMQNINQKTINIINALINYNIQKTEQEKKENLFNIPKYILTLFDCIRINWNKQIKISLPQLRNEKYYLLLKNIFMDTNEEWIDLNIINKLFISCPKIIIDGIILSNKTFDELIIFLSHLNTNKMNKLNQIVFEVPNESSLNGEMAQKQYGKQINELNFIFTYEKTSSLIFITKTDIVNEI